MFHWLYRVADTIRHDARMRRWDADLARGRRGEDLAYRFLQEQGFTVVARNYKTRAGTAEVDLIAWEGDTLVFVEVKSRSSEEFGAPDRAIDDHKRRKILYGADDYLRRASIEPHGGARFDVVSVVFGNPHKIEHLRNAFRPREGQRESL